VFHLVRGIGVVSIKTIFAKTCIRTRNQMAFVETMSTHERSRLRSALPQLSNTILHEYSLSLISAQDHVVPSDCSSLVPFPSVSSSGFDSGSSSNLKSTALLLRASENHYDAADLVDPPLQTEQEQLFLDADDEDDTKSQSDEIKATPISDPVADTIRSWSYCGVPGLRMLPNVALVADTVSKLSFHFFEPQTFRPKPGIIWLNLFGQEVVPVTLPNESRDEFRTSARANVPLFDWASGKFSRHIPFPEGALADFEAVQVLATTVLMPALGFGSCPTGVRYRVEGMSFLMQTPAGGISQVLHTDDDPNADIGEWVSILLPCHDQKGTVFMARDHYDGFERPRGVKPFVSLGDVLAWNRVAHMGSACSDVPPGIELRVALFVFVHVIRDSPTESGQNLEFFHVSHPSNRDFADEERIHYGPDYNFWRSGAFPIIRVCTVCKHGISSSVTPFLESRNTKEPNVLVYCGSCARDKSQVECLVCAWCQDMGALDVAARYPQLDCESEFATATDYVYQCLIEEKTCLHGALHFRPLPLHEYIFVLFSVSEVQAGCRFWMSFFAARDFTARGAPADLLASNQSSLWTRFCSTFLTNPTCYRALVLCWLSAAIGGIGSVFNAKTKLSFGNYPVFYGPHHYSSESARNSSRLAMRAWRDACSGIFHENHLLKAARRAHRIIHRHCGEMTLRCTCVDCDVGNGKHHVIEKCPGPVLKLGPPMATSGNACAIQESERFMQACRDSWGLERDDL
jgi:hypothetical protein